MTSPKNGTALKAVCGIGVALATALIVATVTALGTTRVHSSVLESHAKNIIRVEAVADANKEDIADIKGDVKAIRALLKSIDDKLEAK